MLSDIRTEIERVVGSAGVDIRLETLECGTVIAVVETAESQTALPAEDLLICLRQMPDRAGVLPLREALERVIYHPSEHEIQCAFDEPGHRHSWVRT